METEPGNTALAHYPGKSDPASRHLLDAAGHTQAVQLARPERAEDQQFQGARQDGAGRCGHRCIIAWLY